MASTEACSDGAAFCLSAHARRSVILGQRARFLALVGVCLVLASLALTACGKATPARPVSQGFTGYDWQVVAISHDGQETKIPAQLKVELRFSPGGEFGADDSVNFHSGKYRTTSDGFTTIGNLFETAVGYDGRDPVVVLAMSAMQTFGDGVHATVKRTGDRLVVGVGSYKLTCRRGALRPDEPTPSSTAG